MFRTFLADLFVLMVVEAIEDLDRRAQEKEEKLYVVRLKSARSALPLGKPLFWESFVHDADCDPVHGWGVAYGGKDDALKLPFHDALQLAFDLSESMHLWGRLDVVEA